LRGGGIQEIGGGLRLAGRGEDRPLVAFQDAEPERDIGRVVGARLIRQAQIGTQERGAKLGNQFLESVGFIAEALPELAGAAVRSAGPVAVMPISA
jgi:hypothetical protein